MYTKDPEVISLGLFFEEYVDAVREGDGSRVLRCLKYLLPSFKGSNRKNYSLEVLHTLYQYYYVLSPREAEEMLWCRFVNVSGLPGRNIAADLQMEHLNRVLKDSIHQPSNKSITHAGKVNDWLTKQLVNNINVDVFLKISGRYHRSFKLLKSSSLNSISTTTLNNWIKEHNYYYLVLLIVILQPKQVSLHKSQHLHVPWHEGCTYPSKS